MRILFTGGGTGGHFFPVIAIARELRRIADENRLLDVDLYYIGPNDYGRELMLREDIITETVSAGKVRRYFAWQNFSDFFRTFWGILQAFVKLFRIMPDVVFSKGGYGSFPVLLSARIYRLPVMIHESDAVPGVITRWSAKFARRIGVAFPKTQSLFPPEKTAVVGNPIRKRLLGGIRTEARDSFSIFTQKPVVLVLGGSQGAGAIHSTILAGLKNFVSDFELIHQTGMEHFADVSQRSLVILDSATKGLYHPYAFLDETHMREAYAASDIIISRASSTIFEIAAAGKPSILIPLPSAAQDHQRENAYEYSRAGGAIVIEQNNATPNLVRHTLLRVFESPDELQKMREAAERFARVDSAEIIAREILSLATQHG